MILSIRVPLLTMLIGLVASCTPVQKAETREEAESAIRKVLDLQTAAWNEGDIDRFMEGYWKSDSTQFVGKEIVKGWDATLARYKKSYPDKDAMGSLRFELLEFQRIASDAWLITGKYFLTRKNDSPQGVFTLLFKKRGGKWVIVYDHTS